MVELRYEDLARLRKESKDSGVTTESQNRLPIFEPTLKAVYKKRVFESKYGKLQIEGRLGQVHKNLLETIFWKREVHGFTEFEGETHLKIIYDKQKVLKYLAKTSKYYNYERYEELIKDMMQTYIVLETEKVKVRGTLIMKTFECEIEKPVARKTPVVPERVFLVSMILGSVATELLKNELRFTYDPKPIMGLSSGIAQALVRYLKTQKDHPQLGYHLKQLIQNLEGEMNDKRWWKIREYLKRDIEKLEELGIVIDFKKNRLVVEK